MTAVALTGPGIPRPAALRRRRALRDPRGFGLVELLIALMVLNVGIFATVAAFNAGMLAIRRASHTSAAAAVADKELERYRSMPYSTLQALVGTTTVSKTGPDGRPYSVEAIVSAPASQSSATPGPTSPYQDGRPVVVVTLRVRDTQDGNRLLARAGSSFEQCTQDRSTAACGGGTP